MEQTSHSRGGYGSGHPDLRRRVVRPQQLAAQVRQAGSICLGIPGAWVAGHQRSARATAVHLNLRLEQYHSAASTPEPAGSVPLKRAHHRVV